MTDMTIGLRISQERKKLGLSQEMLGEKMGVSRQAISKWESDSTVPEIDKLIALSKLFDTSVGWLLGVEEDARTSDTLSEKQLYMVEQIVKKYQPQPVPKKKRLLPAACVTAAVLLFLAVGLIAHKAYQTHITDFNVLNNRVAHEVLPKLETLESENSTRKLLAEYTMGITGDTYVKHGKPQAHIGFRAVPNQWQEGDTGYLSIYREGAETQKVYGEWDGAFLTTYFLLDGEDGYVLCFTQLHADGTQEQQLLSNTQIENLAHTLTVTVKTTPGEWLYDGDTFCLQDYEFYIGMPCVESFYGEVFWKKAELILTDSSGEELDRYTLMDSDREEYDNSLYSPNITMMYPAVRFENLEVPRYDEIQLWIYAELSNGLTATKLADSWTTTWNMELRDQ